MPVSAHVLIVDALALLAALAGFLIAFRQRMVRRWLGRASGRKPEASAARLPDADDPAHYAMIIGGVMLMAFGIIIFGFTTAYALMAPAGGA